MALQNIGASNSDDAFYRYKMPKMVTKIEGRGNGIKTNIVNMVDVAKALARPPSYTTKYFGYELGAQSKFDEKTGVSLVNGAHDTAKLAGFLENFIKKYVQCYGCGNPETEVLITKTQMVQLKCAACGFISDVDMRDKLTSFILKNPPEQKKAKDKKALRRAEKERLKEGEAADEEVKKAKSKKKGKEVKSTSSPPVIHNEVAEVEEDDDDNVQWQTDTSAEAARLRVQEQLSAVTADMVMLLDEPVKKVDKTPHQLLVEKVKDDLEKGVGPDAMMSALTGTRKEIVNAVYEGLCDGVEKGFAKVVVKRRKYLAAAVAEGEEGQMMLLGAVEEFCGKVKNPVAVKEVPLVLKALYDADLVEEEFVVKWYEEGLKGGNKDSAIWKNAKPFVEWLQSAESESEG
ncbi:hypothetical protein L2E82_43813 [Cichorium intybus]|uniref:Uncharacterized protein n=1 Tax=Cichorium intybus TaxID=13427 RepID=A0ACB8ZQ79_CICIN|nr:hypothetical protein L2E82_43813 [Cichorium intybus]